ncbi:MAG: hypothetical protein K8T25_19550 [Planctomycetia bacterium]|nr:hypothetical protein [Planctomycetia bacterium]
MTRLAIAALVAACQFFGGNAWAQAPSEMASSEMPLLRNSEAMRLPGHWNVPAKTLGGLQYWTDELIYGDWRIQRNALTEHCRLLDGDNVRQAWGSYDECRAALDRYRASAGIAPLRGRVVIVLHGLGGCSPLTDGLCTYLKQNGRLTTVAVSYASTRVDVDTAAESLGRIVANLPEATEIDFVCHSLGNIVLRRYLAMNTDPATGRMPDARIKRVVMLAAPNHGAAAADKLVKLDVTGQVVGPAARQLTLDWAGLAPKLVTPVCEFGVLAGGCDDGVGYNKLIAGDNDGLVTVDSAKLAGAHDFRVVPAMHVMFMSYTQVQQYTLHFLQEGTFEDEGRRKPL